VDLAFEQKRLKSIVALKESRKSKKEKVSCFNELKSTQKENLRNCKQVVPSVDQQVIFFIKMGA
jgi:hypothetical protein